MTTSTAGHCMALSRKYSDPGGSFKRPVPHVCPIRTSNRSAAAGSRIALPPPQRWAPKPFRVFALGRCSVGSVSTSVSIGDEERQLDEVRAHLVSLPKAPFALRFCFSQTSAPLEPDYGSLLRTWTRFPTGFFFTHLGLTSPY